MRWERPAPMQLWGIDIVGGVMLVDPVTGVLREAKVVTGVDDHSRFCVIAAVVERATGRAVCLALAQALARFGVPEEILTDNGKQFTDRFGVQAAGRCCSTRSAARTAITHRLTAPASPNQNGKVETVPRDAAAANCSTIAGPLPVAWRPRRPRWTRGCADYNTDRPHQALDEQLPVMPGRPVPPAAADRARRCWSCGCPPHLAPVASPADHRGRQRRDAEVAPVQTVVAGWRRSSSTGWCRQSGTCSVAGQAVLARAPPGRA